MRDASASTQSAGARVAATVPPGARREVGMPPETVDARGRPSPNDATPRRLRQSPGRTTNNAIRTLLAGHHTLSPRALAWFPQRAVRGAFVGGAEATSTFSRRMSTYADVRAAASLGGCGGFSASCNTSAANRGSTAPAGSRVPAAPPTETGESTARPVYAPRGPRRASDQITPRMDAPPTAAPHAHRMAARSTLAAPDEAEPRAAEMGCMCGMARACRGTRTRRGVRAGRQARLRRTESEA